MKVISTCFYRKYLGYLKKWKADLHRKPLIIRGARQVGKSKLVEEFSKDFENYVCLNMERYPEDAGLFSSKKPREILNLLSKKISKDLRPEETLLFIDEIQGAPELISVLRYFYEDLPELAVVAAGSLLEFAFLEKKFSVPVGRIEYMFMGPMTFDEFLLALEEKGLLEFITNYKMNEKIPEPFHTKLNELQKLYLYTGGMPEAIKVYKESEGNLLKVNKIHENILNTFRDDFSKYKNRIPETNMRKIFNALPSMVGQKLKYVKLDNMLQAKEIAKVLNLLKNARLYYPVYHTSAAKLPLSSQIDEKFHKPLVLDVGLMNHSYSHDLPLVNSLENINPMYKGALMEQFIGQNLLYMNDFYIEPELYYWAREKPNSKAEVDYVISLNSQIIPIEVKSSGMRLPKSLLVFLNEKNLDFAIRFTSDKPFKEQIDAMLPDGKTNLKFTLVSLPLYFVNSVKNFIK